MNITNRSHSPFRVFPAGRVSTNLVGGKSLIQATGFCMGQVVLEPNGGQVPWHNHEQEEVYYILSGWGEMCVSEECRQVETGDVIYIQPNAYHQLTNMGDEPLQLIYCFSPAGDVAHWQQELDGTLPEAGNGIPELPEGAVPQRRFKE